MIDNSSMIDNKTNLQIIHLVAYSFRFNLFVMVNINLIYYINLLSSMFLVIIKIRTECTV